VRWRTKFPSGTGSLPASDWRLPMSRPRRFMSAAVVSDDRSRTAAKRRAAKALCLFRPVQQSAKPPCAAYVPMDPTVATEMPVGSPAPAFCPPGRRRGRSHAGGPAETIVERYLFGTGTGQARHRGKVDSGLHTFAAERANKRPLVAPRCVGRWRCPAKSVNQRTGFR
jgi:hypothetical protein